MSVWEVIVLFTGLVICMAVIAILGHQRNNILSKYKKSRKEMYYKGYHDGRASVLLKEDPYKEIEADEFFPDISTWSSEIPEETKLKLAQGIAAYNRSVSQRDRLSSVSKSAENDA